MTRAWLAAIALATLALAGCSVASANHAATTHHATTVALPAGVKKGPSSGTYYVNCTIDQCTTAQGAGPFGTTCSQPSTGMAYCSKSLQPVTAATTPPSDSSPVTIDCQMGYVNEPAGSGVSVSQKTFQLSQPQVDTADGYSLSDYEAMQVSIDVQQNITIDTVTVVWYGDGGQEISSGTLGISELITAGQTLSFVYDESMGSDPNPPAGAISCAAPEYTYG